MVSPMRRRVQGFLHQPPVGSRQHRHGHLATRFTTLTGVLTGIARDTMALVPCMSDDEVRESRLGEDQLIAAYGDATDRLVAPPAPEVSNLHLNDEVRAYLRGMVSELEEFGGIGVERVKAIAYGAEPTNGELEELGYVFVQLLHALVGSRDASRIPSSETSGHS